MSKSNFPTSLDVFVSPQKATPLTGGGDTNLSHDTQHAAIMDTLAAIQKAIGITNSTDATSLSYKMAHHTHVVDWSNIQNKPSFTYTNTAGSADYATNSGHAVNADNATNATNANHANTATSATSSGSASSLVTSGWQVVEVSGVLQFKYNGVVKMTLNTAGKLSTADDIVGKAL